MKLLIALIILVPTILLAQASPVPAPTPAAANGLVTWLVANWGMICTFLLAISEGLGFTQVGGILKGALSVLKQLGQNTPST
jgi:hypothetical protein